MSRLYESVRTLIERDVVVTFSLAVAVQLLVLGTLLRYGLGSAIADAFRRLRASAPTPPPDPPKPSGNGNHEDAGSGMEEIRRVLEEVRKSVQGLPQRLTETETAIKGLGVWLNEELRSTTSLDDAVTIRGQLEEARTAWKSVYERLAGSSDVQAQLFAEVQRTVAKLRDAVEALSVRFDDSLPAERQWFARVRKLVEPKTARDLMFLGGPLGVVEPARWERLRDRWTLLQTNPDLQRRLLAIWRSEPAQRIGAHLHELLEQNRLHYARCRQATPATPRRLQYWGDLQRLARRQMVGVSNFFARLEKLSPGEPFETGIRGMTLSEADHGWPIIMTPATPSISLTSQTADQFLQAATEKLLSNWATPAVRLHQELFEASSLEWPTELMPDQAAYCRSAPGGIPLGELADDIQGLAELAGYDYAPIALYAPLDANTTPNINLNAVSNITLAQWNGAEVTSRPPVILRLQSLAWRRRGATTKLDSGATVYVARNDHE